MKRFYYLTASIDSVKQITRDLDQAGIDEGRLHVMGRDPGQLEAEKVHGTTLWEDTDIMHSGFLGALVGAIAGIVLGFVLAGLDPWGWEISLSVVPVTTLFGLCFGAWLGGIRGISSHNHHLEPYWKDVENGEYLLMVDADDEVQARHVTQVMARRDDAREVGRENAYSAFD